MWCAGLDWDRISFFHSSWYRTLFWISAGNSDDSSRMFSLPLSSVCTEPRLFLLFIHQWGAGGAQGVGEDTAGRAGPRAIPEGAMLSIQSRGKRGGVDMQSDGICFSTSPLHKIEPCCPGGAQTFAWDAKWEWIPWFALLFLSVWLWLSLLNCLYLSPQVLSFTLSVPFPIPLWGRNKQPCGAELLSRVKPWNMDGFWWKIVNPQACLEFSLVSLGKQASSDRVKSSCPFTLLNWDTKKS